MMHKLLLCCTVLLPLFVSAQISRGGEPIGWKEQTYVVSLDYVKVEKPNSELISEIASASGDLDNCFRWGIPVPFSIDVVESSSTVFKDGRFVSRIGMTASGAAMISVQFTQFDLAPDERVFVYDNRKRRFVGGLTEESELPDHTMATSVLPGDSIVIEVHHGSSPVSMSRLAIGSIVYGVRDIFHFGEQVGTRDYFPGYDAQPCHNNIVCPIGADWTDQARSVAMCLNTSGTGCTGVMLNNSLQDGTPYFHIANHCYQIDVANWVFYWNYDSPTCIGDTGQTLQTTVGASYVSGLFSDDFVLLELFNTPPTSYNVYYSGWDATGTQPLNQTVIHHPAFDVKKLTVDSNPAGSYVDTNGINMWSCIWDSGIVEFGSSGAPLFDQSHRVIGHMTEGSTSCATVQDDSTGCAKFSDSWDDMFPTTRLRDWLDPSDSVLVMDGFDPNNIAPIVLDLRVVLSGPYDSISGSMTDDLRARGMIPFEEPYTSLGFAHVGSGGGETVSPGVLSVSGNSAVVDWVFVELRDKSDSTVVVSTRSGLLLRNGRVVDLDGHGPLKFQDPPDHYFVAVHHRNHLGIMINDAVALNQTTSLLDVASGTIPMYGGVGTAMESVAGVYALIAGDVTVDGQVKYIGSDNDRDAVLQEIGGSVPTAVESGYARTDTNLDGDTKYIGSANDRDVILISIGGSVPTATRQAQLP